MISKEQLSGTWELESWTIGYSDRDDFSYPCGEDSQGLLLYTRQSRDFRDYTGALVDCVREAVAHTVVGVAQRAVAADRAFQAVELIATKGDCPHPAHY